MALAVKCGIKRLLLAQVFSINPCLGVLSAGDAGKVAGGISATVERDAPAEHHVFGPGAVAFLEAFGAHGSTVSGNLRRCAVRMLTGIAAASVRTESQPRFLPSSTSSRAWSAVSLKSLPMVSVAFGVTAVSGFGFQPGQCL